MIRTVVMLLVLLDQEELNDARREAETSLTEIIEAEVASFRGPGCINYHDILMR
jgi:hypothetical protein